MKSSRRTIAVFVGYVVVCWSITAAAMLHERANSKASAHDHARAQQ